MKKANLIFDKIQRDARKIFIRQQLKQGCKTSKKNK